jgi:hypothetical protein
MNIGEAVRRCRFVRIISMAWTRRSLQVRAVDRGPMSTLRGAQSMGGSAPKASAWMAQAEISILFGKCRVSGEKFCGLPVVRG